MKYVLDTNIVAAALNGVTSVAERLNSILLPDEILLPAVVLAELRYGALSSQRVAENLNRIERVLTVVTFVPMDRSVAERFGTIKALLRRLGVAKSDADLLIAATALEVGGVLISNDHAFADGAIPDLRVDDWLTTLRAY